LDASHVPGWGYFKILGNVILDIFSLTYLPVPSACTFQLCFSPLIPRSHKTTTNPYLQSYIHGGAWRDPLITPLTFLPTITHLLDSHSAHAEEHIAAFASLDYRLSAHPGFPQDVSSTPPQRFRNAKHPDHIQDVCAALAFLQKTYGIADRYILVGHSCGATLAFQTIMGIDGSTGASNSSPGSRFVAPCAIIGIAGIYDLRLLRDSHADVPAYQAFLHDAFGPDEAIWDRVSPARYEGFGEAWKAGGIGKVVALATSAGDELVDGEQLEAMKRRLGELTLGDGNVKVVMWDKRLEGAHDEIWERGEGIAEIVALVIKELVALRS
jgi:acetyl esterase/lipase